MIIYFILYKFIHKINSPCQSGPEYCNSFQQTTFFFTFPKRQIVSAMLPIKLLTVKMHCLSLYVNNQYYIIILLVNASVCCHSFFSEMITFETFHYLWIPSYVIVNWLKYINNHSFIEKRNEKDITIFMTTLIFIHPEVTVASY